MERAYGAPVKLDPRWFVLFHHCRANASWWGERVVRAKTARDAAKRLAAESGEHAPIGEKMRVRVYGPIPDDLAGEFLVGREAVAEPVSALEGGDLA